MPDVKSENDAWVDIDESESVEYTYKAYREIIRDPAYKTMPLEHRGRPT